MQTWVLEGEFKVNQFFRTSEGFSHAQLPTPLILSENKVRFFFATRDIHKHSSIYSIDALYNSEARSFTWINSSLKAIMFPGKPGSFEEHGVYPSSIIKIDDKIYLYYIGWNQGITPPLFYASIGVATSTDGQNFSKVSEGPTLARNQNEPYLVTSPFVCQIENGYKMYFVSGNGWVYSNGRLESRYDVKSIESRNQLNWSSDARETVIPLRDGEKNIARPWVAKFEENDFLYFCYLTEKALGYQIGVAKKNSNGQWIRIDDELDFDSVLKGEHLAYPALFELMNERFMVANGINYGSKGFYIFRNETP